MTFVPNHQDRDFEPYREDGPSITVWVLPFDKKPIGYAAWSTEKPKKRKRKKPR